MKFEDRAYRNLIQNKSNLVDFQVVVKETDLWIRAFKNLSSETRECILKHRGYIENYISAHPKFVSTLNPWPADFTAPKIVKTMIAASQATGVGPMAAVAGAVAETVGSELLSHSDQIVVENGGDVFFNLEGVVSVGLYAGDSPLSLKIGIQMDTNNKPISVCTSSGTIGHSLSFGIADAVTVVSESCALADAAATAIANHVKHHDRIGSAIEFGNKIEGIIGIVVIVGKNMGIWGDIKVVRL